MTSAPLRILVVDDSALYRKVVRVVLEEISGVEVIGAAINGRAALERILVERPDVITLDMEMPELDGLGLLSEIKSRQIDLAAIMISSLTLAGATATNDALRMGAFDFVLKPSAASAEESIRQLRVELVPRIEACRAVRKRTAALRGIGAAAGGAVPGGPALVPTPKSPATAAAIAARRPPQIIGVGVSTGGPVALQNFLPLFPADFPLPIVIVQHMPPIFTKTLAENLNRSCPLEVVEGQQGISVQPGRVILAPGGRQMRIARDQQRVIVQITDDPPERNCRPAVDYLFRSLASEYGPRAWGVILTGMGDDGTIGCRILKEKGSTIMAQDEATSVVYGMPRAVAEAGLVDFVGPLDQLAQRLRSACMQGALV